MKASPGPGRRGAGAGGAAGVDLYRFILGATPKPELIQRLEFDSIDSRRGKEAILQRWERSVAAFREIVMSGDDLPEAIKIRTASGAAAHYAATARTEPSFRHAFSGMRVSFCEVEIDRLVASQRAASIGHVRRCRVPAEERGIAELCLNPGSKTAPVTFVYSRKGMVFSSPDPGLVALQTGDGVARVARRAGLAAPGRPAYVVKTYIGFGASTAYAFRIGSRLILANGYHRLLALRSAGLKVAPIAVVDIEHPELELADRLIQFPAAYLVTSPRPPLLKDFFDSRLTADLRLRPKASVVSVEISHEQHAIPAW